MSKRTVFISELLHDGHLSIPDSVIKILSLKSGAKVSAIIETQQFDKASFLKLSGIWNNKTDAELDVFRSIVNERDLFGRGEVRL